MPSSRRSKKRPWSDPPTEIDLDRVRLSLPRTERKGGREFQVQESSGGNAETGKTWSCPGCVVPIEIGVTHVVAWDVLSGPDARRHFHKHCWKLFDGRAII